MGLIIGISTFIVWLAALFSAQIVVGTIVGQWIMGRTSETWQFIGRMVVGVILVRVMGMIPFLGFWVRVAVVLWGMGAISLAIYRRFHPAMGATAPVNSCRSDSAAAQHHHRKPTTGIKRESRFQVLIAASLVHALLITRLIAKKKRAAHKIESRPFFTWPRTLRLLANLCGVETEHRIVQQQSANGNPDPLR